MIVRLRGAVSTLVSSSKAVVAAEKLIDQSADHLKSVTNRYKEGLAPYTEFADARILFERSRVGYVNAVYDGFLAAAEIERLLGAEPLWDAPAEGVPGGDDASAEDTPAEETGE